MKKQLLKPGFEFIFALSIIAILGLPPLVLAQNQKNVEIQIINGDTTINGKDIKKLTAQERKEAIAELNNMPQTFNLEKSGDRGNGKIVIKRRNKSDNHEKQIVIERSFLNDSDMPMLSKMDGTDSTHKMFTYRFNKPDGSDSSIAFDYKFDVDPKLKVKINRDFKFNRITNDNFAFNRRNTQTFNYSNTDNDGISTSISFKVGDPSKERLKSIAGIEKAGLALNDLSLIPEFSTGKTTMTFNLAAKTTAGVTFTDRDGKTLWTDKATAGNFLKKFSLPINGIYYLQVKQGTSVAVKRIVKED
jgi:hypothetical protein